ncbi:mitochondrial carrier homolog 2 [Sitodiplosis mosellana]|uniref:mitochondrial carrier homolog 2 n=1 Tax=Sitodiplosis mosellana TaxID=263140 RepID=UPI0024444B1C|nr:mitochondrial carrier homolog 2 [Sitodiplosis mosellana]
MDSTLQHNEDTQANRLIKFGMRMGVSAALHPFEYAKVLIQIGYEPIAPQPGKTFLGRPAMILPNIFQYVKHIKKVDGLAGCYRGLTPKLVGSVIGVIGSKRVAEKFGLDDNDDNESKDDSELTEEESYERFLKSLKRDLILHASGIIITHPFQVISIRMMAQFVGRETIYKSIWSSIKEIFGQEGLFGFFSGLIPKLICDLTCIALTSTTCYLVNKYYISDQGNRTYFAGFIQFVYASVLYPIQVVSTCMVVTGSRLQAGSPPHMPVYKNWSDCLTHLKSTNQHKRGSSLFWRYYHPQIRTDSFVPYPKLSKY